MPLQMLKHFIHTNDVRGFRKRIASLGPACGTQNARRAQDTYDLLRYLTETPSSRAISANWTQDPAGRPAKLIKKRSPYRVRVE